MPGLPWNDKERQQAVDTCHEIQTLQGRSLKGNMKEVADHFNATLERGRPRRTFHGIVRMYMECRDEMQPTHIDLGPVEPRREIFPEMGHDAQPELVHVLDEMGPQDDPKALIIGEINKLLHGMDLARLLQAHARVYVIEEDHARERARTEGHNHTGPQG
jgi:hypothetical protein